MEEGLGSSSSAIDSSNIGFRLLKKQGWKEGTGLGIAEQGRLEPLQPHVKNNKRGLGAEKTKKKCVKLHLDSSTKEHNNNVSFGDLTGLCGLSKEQVDIVQGKKLKMIYRLTLPAYHFTPMFLELDNLLVWFESVGPFNRTSLNRMISVILIMMS